MKDAFLKLFFAIVLLGMVSQIASGQNKSQAYYNSHEREILPDAQSAFQSGDYDRTVELCRWHYIIVGDNRADSLRDRARRCSALSRQMADLKNQGKMSEAKEVALNLLSLHPEAASAKQFMKELEEMEKAAQPEPEHDPEPVKEPEREPEQEPEPELEKEPESQPVPEETVEPALPVDPALTPIPKPKPTEVRNNQFVIKAGTSIVDIKQLAFAPCVDLGMYNIGGSPLGVETGFYFAPGLASKTASMFGIDASAVLRAVGSIYPKAGLGFFSCKSSETGTSTNGLCAIVGITFIIGGHFCVEVGAKYYPQVMVNGTTPVSTSGITYDFPTPIEVLGAGVAPMVHLGWAF